MRIRPFLLGAICVVIVIGGLSYHRLIRAPALTYIRVLGVPGPVTQHVNLPTLPLHLAFDQARARIVARQENGQIVFWNLKTGGRVVVARTKSAFAYCRAKQRLLIGDDIGVSLHDLTTGRRHHITGGDYDFAAWRADCGQFALASGDSRAVELWRTKDAARLATVSTRMPVRNGLALSADGQYIAVAQGTHSAIDGHRTRLDIFLVSKNGMPTRSTGIDKKDTILGLWKMVFTPDASTLLVSSQTKGMSGLRSLSSGTGNIYWGEDGFKAYWVRALAVSPDGKLLVSGDENGLLRGWDVRTGRRLFQRRTGLVIQSLAFSDDGQQLAVALWDSTIGIVDMATLPY